LESEKTLEKKLGERVHALGGWSLKFLPFIVAGLPDRICLFPGGRVAFAEIKTTGQKLRPVQEAVIRKLERLGFEVYIIDCTDNINELIDDFT
jgi:phosphoserine phosphatase